MKKSFKLEGLHCANCAAKMEDKLNKLESVKEATIGFMSMRLTLDAEDMDSAVAQSQTVISKIESSCKIMV